MESDDQAEQFPRLVDWRSQEAHKKALFELLLYWFAFTFIVGCLGVMLGLLYASGGTFLQLISRSPSVLLWVLFLAIGAYALTRRTLNLGSRDSDASKHLK